MSRATVAASGRGDGAAAGPPDVRPWSAAV